MAKKLTKAQLEVRRAKILPIAEQMLAKMEGAKPPEPRPPDLSKDERKAMTHPATAASESLESLTSVDFVSWAQELGERNRDARSGSTGLTRDYLVAQAATLDALFNRLVRAGMSTLDPGHREMNLRLALKAQSQCRGAVMALNELVSPRPVAFITAGQANVTTGPQQVNNGVGTADLPQNKLLEQRDGERLDTRATGAAAGTNRQLAPVGEIDGAEDPER